MTRDKDKVARKPSTAPTDKGGFWPMPRLWVWPIIEWCNEVRHKHREHVKLYGENTRLRALAKKHGASTEELGHTRPGPGKLVMPDELYFTLFRDRENEAYLVRKESEARRSRGHNVERRPSEVFPTTTRVKVLLGGRPDRISRLLKGEVWKHPDPDHRMPYIGPNGLSSRPAEGYTARRIAAHPDGDAPESGRAYGRATGGLTGGEVSAFGGDNQDAREGLREGSGRAYGKPAPHSKILEQEPNPDRPSGGSDRGGRSTESIPSDPQARAVIGDRSGEIQEGPKRNRDSAAAPWDPDQEEVGVYLTGIVDELLRIHTATAETPSRIDTHEVVDRLRDVLRSRPHRFMNDREHADCFKAMHDYYVTDDDGPARLRDAPDVAGEFIALARTLAGRRWLAIRDKESRLAS